MLGRLASLGRVGARDVAVEQPDPDQPQNVCPLRRYRDALGARPMILFAVFLAGIGVGFLMASLEASLIADRQAFRWPGFVLLTAAIFVLSFYR